MPVSLAQRASAHSDVAMVVYLEPWLRGRRVGFVGPRLKALTRVREAADAVEAFRLDARDGRLVPVRQRRDGKRRAPSAEAGALRWPEAELDVVFITELEAAADPEALLEQAARAIGPEGLVVVGGTCGHDDLHARMAAHFEAVAMLGELPFTAYAVFRCDVSQARDEPVVLDDTLAGRRERMPARFWAVGSARPRSFDAFAVIQVPRDGLPARGKASTAEPELDDGLQEREVSRLEAHLAERAAALRESERETRRRGVLVRDILERSAGAGSGEPAPHEELVRLRQERDAAVSRAMEAEVARTEAQFRLDEVAGHLAAARADAGGSGATADAPDLQRLAGWRAGAWLAAREQALALSTERDRLASRNQELEQRVTDLAQRITDLAAERESLEETLVLARGEAERKERWAREQVDGLERALDEARAALASLGESVTDSTSAAGTPRTSAPLDVPDVDARAPSEDRGGDADS